MSPTLSQRFFQLAAALGLAVIAWIGWGFVGHSALALVVTALIAATFVLGALELQRFRAQTAGLEAALAQLEPAPASQGELDEWLSHLPAALREPVRQRVETGRGVLPGPALTPYLVGLLVMLGMLGTFLGMVLTFQGTVFALEGSGDLGAMRAALAAPIRGLGLSFGTSVAGVAASALLGLMAAQSRRERAECARRLDAGIASYLRGFSLAHRREAAQQAAQQASLDATLGALGQLQAQGEALPTVAEKLAALMDRLERRGEQLDAQLLERQAQFQREAAAAYADLSRRVGLAMEENLSAGLDRALANFHDRFGERSAALLEQVQGHLAQGESRQVEADRQRAAAFGEALQATSAVVTQMREEMVATGDRVRQDMARADEQARAQRAQAETREQQLLEERAALLQRLDGMSTALGEQAQAQRQAIEGLAASSAEALAQAAGRFQETLAQSGQAHATALAQTSTAFTEAAAHGSQRLEETLAQAGTRFDEALAASGTRFSDVLAESSSRFTNAVADSSGRFDDALVQGSERARELLAQSAERASALLAQSAERFGALLAAQSELASQQAALATDSGALLAAQGEAFGQSVQGFQASTEKLLGTLQRIEAALASAGERHDEQLAYYVAQAREVVDLSIAAQQGVIDNLRQLQGRARAQARAEALEGDAA